MSNEALLSELRNALEKIQNKIQGHAISDPLKQGLEKLKFMLNTSKMSFSSSQLFFDESEKKNLMKLIMQLDSELKKVIYSVEKEMDGVKNYSDYEREHIDQVAMMKYVREGLSAMLQTIHSVRLKTNDIELPKAIKMKL